MFSKEKVLDDLARVAGGTVNVISDLGRNIREDIKSRAEDAATRLDLVPREEFQRLETVLQHTRTLVEEQSRRITALEKQLATKTKAESRTGKKTAPKKGAAK